MNNYHFYLEFTDRSVDFHATFPVDSLAINLADSIFLSDIEGLVSIAITNDCPPSDNLVYYVSDTIIMY